MELDVTHMIEDSDEMPMLSGSVAELGQGAGKFTWNNSKTYAADRPLLVTDDAREQARAWLKDFGAWDAEEIAAWDDNELNALVVQFIAGDIREMEGLTGDDYAEYQALCEQGTCSGRLFRNDDGRWYFYMGKLTFA